MGWSNDPTQVRGDLFKESGKWGYTVQLDYSWMSPEDYEHWDLWASAKRALKVATTRGTSGVSTSEVRDGWYLVVLEPYGKTGHPIIVRSDS